jgi:hypothetical protein
MSLGSWDPKAGQAKAGFSIDKKVLSRFIDLSRQQQLEDLGQQLSSEEQQQQAPLMQLGKDSWFEIAGTFSDQEIEELMRFFTIAEKLPGWEAGDKSPVIWLGKILKKRSAGINRELVIWIKAHSNNQFLPHGSLL